MTNRSMTRRQYLAASGAGALAISLGVQPASAQLATIRQGYQTNIWGMPTYYLMKSGYLEKRGLKTEDFAVPSGNLTMQQMVARQVDMGTYAGPSFILGHDKGGLIAIAQIVTWSRGPLPIILAILGVPLIVISLLVLGRRRLPHDRLLRTAVVSQRVILGPVKPMKRSRSARAASGPAAKSRGPATA